MKVTIDLDATVQPGLTAEGTVTLLAKFTVVNGVVTEIKMPCIGPKLKMHITGDAHGLDYVWLE